MSDLRQCNRAGTIPECTHCQHAKPHERVTMFAGKPHQVHCTEWEDCRGHKIRCVRITDEQWETIKVHEDVGRGRPAKTRKHMKAKSEDKQ